MELPQPTWAFGSTTPTKQLEKPSSVSKSPKNSSGVRTAKEPNEDGEIDLGSFDEAAGQVEVPDEIRVLSQGQNLGDRDFIILTSAALLAQLPKDERVLRTTFVKEYLYDFDPLLAAIRVGFLNVRHPSERLSPAMHAARALMAEPVVQRLIKECMLEVIRQDDSENLVITGLIREATNHGITGNAAARNGAFKMLADMIEKAKGDREGGEKIKGNVMLAPVEQVSHDDWEKKAMQSQKDLRDSVRA